jgi:hypothetical protein
MRTEDLVELREKVVGEGNYAFVIGQRHWGSLRSVWPAVRMEPQ